MTGGIPRVRIGPAGWSYADWQGRVYPEAAGRQFDRLAYLAQYFDTIEINSSFYRLLTPAITEQWVRRVASRPEFKFTAKLYRAFTHQRDEATVEDERQFKLAIEPLAQAGKLGAILAQFPWSFKRTRDARVYLQKLLDQFHEYPLVVEFRHASWDREEVYRSLAERGVGFCNIDQPLLDRCIAPSDHVTAAVAYVRLHGRNADQWFAQSSDAAARYDYLYSPEELAPWVDRIRHMASQADEVYVITNNHFQGKGVVNALEIKSMMLGEPVPVPEPLQRAYPRLSAVARPL
ncbi:MAG: DUF72 domain-containing protein [Acidobacteriota bacterium]|nr:DUF72 domain-containing protein [Blastocatellia bacterium]MDW8240597.1 DUF72 domain-containing protein [Acidobacteriota bacterium]